MGRTNLILCKYRVWMCKGNETKTTKKPSKTYYDITVTYRIPDAAIAQDQRFPIHSVARGILRQGSRPNTVALLLQSVRIRQGHALEFLQNGGIAILQRPGPGLQLVVVVVLLGIPKFVHGQAGHVRMTVLVALTVFFATGQRGSSSSYIGTVLVVLVQQPPRRENPVNLGRVKVCQQTLFDHARKGVRRQGSRGGQESRCRCRCRGCGCRGGGGGGTTTTTAALTVGTDHGTRRQWRSRLMCMTIRT